MGTGNDLDYYEPARLNDDYEVFNPVNAWPGASNRIRLGVRWLPDERMLQTGADFDSDDPTVWERVRSLDGRTWSEWTMIGAGGGGIEEAPTDDKIYGRKNAAWWRTIGKRNAALDWDAESQRIANVADPTADQDAATKAYVDAAIAGGGADGQRGSLWSDGEGPPSVSGDELPGDQYLDTATGNIYAYQAVAARRIRR